MESILIQKYVQLSAFFLLRLRSQQQTRTGFGLSISSPQEVQLRPYLIASNCSPLFDHLKWVDSNPVQVLYEFNLNAIKSSAF